MARHDPVTQAEAAKLAGYSERSAKQMGSDIWKRPRVQARIKELKDRSCQVAVTATGITKAWVIQEMLATYYAAREEKQLGTARQALVNIGSEIAGGMFIQRGEFKIDWPEDLSLLDERQLQVLEHYAKRLMGKALEIKGEVMDVVPEKKEEDGW